MQTCNHKVEAARSHKEIYYTILYYIILYYIILYYIILYYIILYYIILYYTIPTKSKLTTHPEECQPMAKCNVMLIHCTHFRSQLVLFGINDTSVKSGHQERVVQGQIRIIWHKSQLRWIILWDRHEDI